MKTDGEGNDGATKVREKLQKIHKRLFRVKAEDETSNDKRYPNF